jgi:hypothetical protein
MADAIGSHLRDLESEANDAEREVEEYRERSEKRIDSMNSEISQLVAKVQLEKAAIKEQIERKQLYARKKYDEYQSFKARESVHCPLPQILTYLKDALHTSPSSRVPTHAPTFQASTTHPVPAVPALPALPAAPETMLAINSVPPADEPPIAPEAYDLPKPVLKTPIAPENSAIVIQQKYLPDTPIIVRSPTGKWLEIRCMLCGG